MGLIILFAQQKKFILEHEMGHARIALSYMKRIDSKSAVFILLPYKCEKVERYQQDGILIYYVGKKLSKLVSSRIAGVAWYDSESIMVNDDIFIEESLAVEEKENAFLRITVGGVEGGKRYLLRKSNKILFLLLSLAIQVAIFWVYGNKEMMNLIVAGLFCPVTYGMYYLYMRLIVLNSAGFFPKRELSRFEKSIMDCKDGKIKNPVLGDRAKIKYNERYRKCLKIIKEKEIKISPSYSDMVRKLIDIGIDVNEDKTLIESLPKIEL